MSATNPLTPETPLAGDTPSSAPSPEPKADAAGLADVKQLGLIASIVSLSYVFWIVGAMEMVERLAYYGVKIVAGLYAVAPQKEGGLGTNLSDFGWILSIWALVQTIVPAFTGGLSDRYGYKETIFVSTVIKIAGYLVMAFFPSYWGFFAGALILATGTAIFKPGIQATLVRSTKRENSSMAWGIFYQTVNIGGFLGPLVANQMRQLAWRNVFFACAAIICLNFLLLLTYKEPGKEERLQRARLEKEGKLVRKSLVVESLEELKKPHVWLYLLIFSGFWFMFNALFDVLPNHVQDWVDTRSIVTTLFDTRGTSNPVVKFLLGMNKEGTEIQPEGLTNINAGMIMVACFLFAALSGKMRATTSMLVGTLAASIGLAFFGVTTLAWVTVFGIVLFSVGEMLASPKFLEFIGNFAPADKKAMYLGFSQVPLAIGWTLEGKLGPTLYDHYGSKENFARQMLADKGLMPAAALGELKQGEAFSKLVELTHMDRWELTRELAQAHSIGIVWYVSAALGLATAVGIYLYGRWVAKLIAAK